MFRAAFVSLLALSLPLLADEAKPKKIVILAGPKSHGPVGNGIHDYGWSARLIKMMLEHSNVKEKVRVEIHLAGWPRDERTLDDADTIMVISDGRDGDQFAEAPHLASPERVRFMERQIKRGCGFATFHFSTFAPNQYSKQMLQWCGGFFQWETNGKRQWYSAITTKEAEVKIASPDHPISRGLKPFAMKEEFYYNIRFSNKDSRLAPIWTVPSLPGREPDGRVVAWAREREDGGRGFGTTCGHFYDNWKHPEFRKLILNSVCWTAHVEIPKDGVEARFYTHEEITSYLDPPIRVLLFAGNDAHKWHNWEKTTPAIKAALERDSRVKVDVSHDIEDLARRKLGNYQVIVQNYCNWQDPKPLSDASKKAFIDFLQHGGGLIVLHFANGAWHFSLPNAGQSDWPEYRKIVRRVWNHNAKPPSGHDAFGLVMAEPTKVKHAITEGLKPFEVTDELYFRQDGTEPIEPLIVARSRITRQDEPLAWVYTYGKGRVFQSLLGHSEKTYDAYEVREMLRRAVAWCANREVRKLTRDQDQPATPASGLGEGKFGKGLNAVAGGAFVAGRKEYREPPLTAECWAKLTGKPYHILIANELKSSATHWEIFAEAGNGGFTAYLPGYKPDHVRSHVDITDGRWHHLAMILEKNRVRLAIDGKTVADEKTAFQNGKTIAGRLAIGSLAGKEIGCGGIVDEVRITQGVREFPAMPQAAAKTDENTVGLWHLDSLENGKFADESKLKNPAVFEPSAPVSVAPAGPTLSGKLDYAPVDPTYKVTLIDRSQNDTYIGVKVDSQGQIFVGGRESLFVFEPDGQGGYRPRRELVHFHQDAIIIGIEYRGNDLYVLTCNALYLLPGARAKREGIKPKRLLWGIPLDLHVTFHCLAWGPEGDLYLNHGDPLLNYGDFSRPDHWGHWTWHLADGSTMPYTGTGAVLRIRPDGTHLQVVATGLRGPVGLCFDPNWNLFTNDNDHESIPDRYGYWRLLHVTPGIDFAWPRGWMASRSPERSDLIEPMISTAGRGVPVGLACMDDGHLIQSRWDSRSINRYTLNRKGATFTADESPFLVAEGVARPTGLTVGRDNRVFATIHYLPGNVGSPHCVSDLIMITPAKAPPTKPVDLTKLSEPQLREELASHSWARIADAHQELLRRGLNGLSTPLENEMSRAEATRLAMSSDLYERQRATRYLARHAAIEQIESLMNDRNPAKRLAGLLAAGIRLTVPPNDFVPPQDLPLNYSSGNAFFKLTFADQKEQVDLRTLGRCGSFTTGEWWKIKQNSDESKKLKVLLVSALDSPDEKISSQAAYYLSLLRDKSIDADLQRREAKRKVARVKARNLSQTLARAWVVGPMPFDQRGDKLRFPQFGPIDLTAAYGPSDHPKVWTQQDLAEVKFDSDKSGQVAHVYFRVHSNRRQIMLFRNLLPPIWHNGTRVRPVPDLEMFVELQPGSNDILTYFSRTPKSIDFLVEERVSISLPDKLDSAELAKRLRESAKSGDKIPPEFLTVNWLDEAKRGDAANGRRLFGSLACAKCHAIAAGQAGGGAPSLTDVRKRFTVPHVVESILLPSKQVAEPFRASRIELKTGQSISGLVVAEQADQIELLLPDATRKTIAKNEIEERTITPTSPMPAGLVKTPAELRDLLAYLFSDNPQP